MNTEEKSVKRNTLANYVGQCYLLIAAMTVTPLYLQILGAEAYGLVGFFSLMQAWLNLLDIGLTPTLGRQIAYARGTINGMTNFKKILKSFESIFILISFSIVAFTFLSSNWISEYWLKIEELESSVVAYCVSLMGIIVSFRWFAGLYRSGINGLEDQVWLNFFNVASTSFKFVGALALLTFVTNDIAHFFEYQLFIGLIELIFLIIRFYNQLPKTSINIGIISFHYDSARKVAPFALSIAYTSGIWIAVSQTDKLVLSGLLTLKEFGYFSLVVLITGSINTLSGPISQAVQPRLTYLVSAGRTEEMFKLYRSATQLVTLAAISVSITIALFSEQLVFAWTGDVEATLWAKDVIFWYALANGILAIMSFQYYLQVAFGQLRLHVIGATLSAAIDVPIIIIVAMNFGALGSGIAWFALKLAWTIVWTAIVHRKLAPGLHSKWFFYDFGFIALSTILTATIMSEYITFNFDQSRQYIFFKLVFVGLIVLGVSSMSSSYIRLRLKQWIKKTYAIFEK